MLLVSRVLDHLPEKERAALLAQNPIMISMDNATRTAFNTEACHRAAKNLALPHCMVFLPVIFNLSKYALTDADRANMQQLPRTSMGQLEAVLPMLVGMRVCVTERLRPSVISTGLLIPSSAKAVTNEVGARPSCPTQFGSTLMQPKQALAIQKCPNTGQIWWCPFSSSGATSILMWSSAQLHTLVNL